MRVPALRGIIARRLLVNYRVDPDALSRALPQPFEPLLVNGYGVAGICLIRLTQIKPAGLPGAWGFSSENGAHRIAVRTPDGGEAVYIPRRDTGSRLNTLVGGRLFPGVHHHAEFVSHESDDRVEVRMRSDDGETRVEVAGCPTDTLPTGSVFSDTDAASRFFERGSLGYSDTHDPTEFDGLELRTRNWRVTALDVDHCRSSFFEQTTRFPAGTVEYDNALLMRDIDHEWHAKDSLYCTGIQETQAISTDPER